MRLDNTGRTIHMGTNFVVAPAPSFENARHLEFQRRLAEEKIEFTQVNKQEGQVVFQRQETVGLQVQVKGGDQQVGQLIMIARTDPESSAIEAGVSVDKYRRESETVCEIFQEVWPEQNQIVSRDATLRRLFDSGTDHAFQYLWERRLEQPEESLRVFERPVLGGGLRFVMPPAEAEGDPFIVEVKIESFFADPSKIFVETQLKWPKPRANASIDPASLIRAVENYTDERVISFINSE